MISSILSVLAGPPLDYHHDDDNEAPPADKGLAIAVTLLLVCVPFLLVALGKWLFW